MANIFDNIGKTNQSAKLTRTTMRWRSPVFGYLDMYLNPQNVQITDRKISTSTRTKAGFVYQYAGEDLTKISISGITGSAGIEGINALEAVYRSEQIGFSQIALQLEQDFATQTITNTVSSGIGAVLNFLPGASSVASTVGSFAGLSLDYATQPFPSLASLATAIELEWQGVTYRGYFESFSVTESANSPGHFEFNIDFTSYARIGQRSNFMPWHRTPSKPLNSSDNSNFSIGAVESDQAYTEKNAVAALPEPTDTNTQSGKNFKNTNALVGSSVNLSTRYNT